MCGEKIHQPLPCRGARGSPPRVRGKATRSQMPMRPPGITPAYAGKRSSCRPSACRFRDHPRVCGEKPQMYAPKKWMKGSPPRMRGKDGVNDSAQAVTGITPACAGKRQSWTSATWLQRDHPRVCGEKAVCWPLVWIIWGSPPRVRGKAGRALEGACIPGITPAYAGKSMMLHHSIPDTAAHDGRQVLRDLHRHLKCDWDGHIRLVQVGNVVHERALMPDVHESQSRRTPQRHNDRMGQPVQAGMHGGSHGCRGRAAAPKCPPPGSERSLFRL